MNPTVVVAILGILGTLLGAWFTAYLHHRRTRELDLLSARLRVYGDCVAALYEYDRATFNRVRARIERPHSDRDGLRQEAYRCNTSARVAIGQAAILSGKEAVRTELEKIRKQIGHFNRAEGTVELKAAHDAVLAKLETVLRSVRADLTRT